MAIEFSLWAFKSIEKMHRWFLWRGRKEAREVIASSLVWIFRMLETFRGPYGLNDFGCKRPIRKSLGTISNSYGQRGQEPF
jgi:hypothetical protein